MKFEFEERELKAVENIQQDLDNGKDIPLFVYSTDREYALRFKCTDIAKANVLIHFLINRCSTDTLKDCGIEILSIDYRDNKNDIIEVLEDTLQRLKGV